MGSKESRWTGSDHCGLEAFKKSRNTQNLVVYTTASGWVYALFKISARWAWNVTELAVVRVAHMAFKIFVWPIHNREDKPASKQMQVFRDVAEKFESIIIGSKGSNKFAIKASVRESSGNAAGHGGVGAWEGGTPKSGHVAISKKLVWKSAELWEYQKIGGHNRTWISSRAGNAEGGF